MQAKIARLMAFAVIFGGSLFAQSSQQLPSTVTVTELPPEPIPAGTCKNSYSGYLELSEHGKPKKINFTSQQIGDYVKKRLGEGYSLSLYPQASGRLFVIEDCETTKASQSR
jgi:hypothetical protein